MSALLSPADGTSAVHLGVIPEHQLSPEVVSFLSSLDRPIYVQEGRRSILILPDQTLAHPRGDEAHMGTASPNPHKPVRGELKAALVAIAKELKLPEGRTITSKKILQILRLLKDRGIQTTFESVRVSMRHLHYYTDRKG